MMSLRFAILLLAYVLIGFVAGFPVGMIFTKWLARSSGDPKRYFEIWDDADRKLKKKLQQGE